MLLALWIRCLPLVRSSPLFGVDESSLLGVDVATAPSARLLACFHFSLCRIQSYRSYFNGVHVELMLDCLTTLI